MRLEVHLQFLSPLFIQSHTLLQLLCAEISKCVQACPAALSMLQRKRSLHLRVRPKPSRLARIAAQDSAWHEASMAESAKPMVEGLTFLRSHEPLVVRVSTFVCQSLRVMIENMERSMRSGGASQPWICRLEGLRLRCLDESLWLCRSLTFQTPFFGSFSSFSPLSSFVFFVCFDLPRLLQYQVLLLLLHLHRQMSPSN